MLKLRDLRDAGAHVVSAAGIPYGYTLTVWGAGALCTARFGLPSPAEAFGFVGGASVAYFGLAVGLRRASTSARGGGVPLLLWENCAALPVLAASYGISRLVPGPGASFFLVPLVATFLYLAAVSVLAACFHFGQETPRWEHDESEHGGGASRKATLARCAAPRSWRSGRGPGGQDGEG